MDEYTSEDARKQWRRILNEAEHGEPVGITRYGKRIAVVVPAEWHSAALAALKDTGYPLSKEQSALLRAYEAAREAGNPFVVDPASLEIRESGR